MFAHMGNHHIMQAVILRRALKVCTYSGEHLAHLSNAHAVINEGADLPASGNSNKN